MTIGVDIGSSAVRAAQIEVGKDGRRTLARFAQVGLPPGLVVDGEIGDVAAVAEALRRLWSEGGFTSTDVVVGVSGPRVFIRQADVPALSNDEMRSSLRFNAQELVPISLDDAGFDFSVLGSADRSETARTAGTAGGTSPGRLGPGGGGEPMQRILLAAAPRDLLRTYGATLKAAGLNPTVMDPAPLALLRAVPRSAVGHAEAAVEIIVSIGAELTTVAVREQGVPRFIRSLTIGGAQLTETIATTMQLEMAVAERLKRGAVPPGSPQQAQARRAVSTEMRELAEEIRATIDFFVSQSGLDGIDRLLVTGGAAQTEGLAASIAGDLPAPVMVVDPLAGLDTSALGYDPGDLARISAGGATAIGLALWPTDGPLIRLSLLPEEIVAARRARRVVSVAAGGLAVLVGVLVVAGGVELLAAHSAENRVRSAQAQAVVLSGQVSRLSALTAVHSEVGARLALQRSALAGDIDWVRMIGQLATVMPPDLTLSSLNGSRTLTAATSTAAPAGSAPPGPVTVGTLNLQVAGTGGLPAAASWLEGLDSDPDLTQVSVGGVTVKSNGGAVTFSSTAELTTTSQSQRAQEAAK